MKSFVLNVIGRTDEIYENPAVATQYSNEEIILTHVRNRCQSVGQSVGKSSIFDIV